jgi:hypothetical protein
MMGPTASSALLSAEHGIIRPFVRWCIFPSRICTYSPPPFLLFSSLNSLGRYPGSQILSRDHICRLSRGDANHCLEGSNID